MIPVELKPKMTPGQGPLPFWPNRLNCQHQEDNGVQWRTLGGPVASVVLMCADEANTHGIPARCYLLPL